MSDHRVRGVVTGAGLIAMLAVLLPAPAYATGVSTTKTTVTAVGSTDFAYGSDWVVAAHVSRIDSKETVTGAEGTIDVYADGGAAAVAAGLPIQADGTAYVTQSTAPLLAAGPHTLTAVFHPSTDSTLASSQTAQPLAISILPLTIDPTAALDGWGDEAGTISLDMTGTYLTAFGVPAGTWTVSVQSATGDVAGTQTIAQAIGAELPLVVPVDATLERGEDYTVTTDFTPDTAIVGGVTLSAIPAMTASTQVVTVAETFGTPVELDLPVIALFVLAAVLILGVLALVLALARVRRRPSATASAGVDSEDTDAETARHTV